MAVKILIQRKVRPGRENEFGEALRKLRSKAIHAQGYISGETLHSVEEPSLHLVSRTGQSLEAGTRRATAPERQAFEEKTDAMLQEPAKVTPYQSESNLPPVDARRTSLELSLQDE